MRQTAQPKACCWWQPLPLPPGLRAAMPPMFAGPGRAGANFAASVLCAAAEHAGFANTQPLQAAESISEAT